MATQLDLQEQEQLDALKAFWKQYGNLITTVLLLAALAWAGWNGWAWYQRDQATKASGLYDALDQAVQVGDAERAKLRLAELRDRYPRTAQAAQGGLLAAKVMHDQGQIEDAKAALGWVANEAADPALRQVARLRLAAVLLQLGATDDALALLDAIDDPAFAALAADRRGDVLASAGKVAEARAAYEKAFAGMEAGAEYRRLVEAKLTALGAAPAASGSQP